jgi:hypothetical protein
MPKVLCLLGGRACDGESDGEIDELRRRRPMGPWREVLTLYIEAIGTGVIFNFGVLTARMKESTSKGTGNMQQVAERGTKSREWGYHSNGRKGIKPQKQVMGR